MQKKSSIIDPVKAKLSSDIFNDKNFVKSQIKNLILEKVAKITEDLKLTLNDAWLIGSMTTYQYTSSSDIDVNINVEDSIDKERDKVISEWVAKKYNEKHFISTHPVNFKIVPSNFDLNKADGAYNLTHNHWIKKPKKLEEQDVDDLIRKCSNSKNFIRAVADYFELKQELHEYFTSQKLSEKSKQRLIDSIYDSMLAVVKDYQILRNIRRKEFNKKLGKKIQSSNFRCSNVVYKILESYGVARFIHALEQALDGYGEEEFKLILKQFGV